MLQEKSSSVKLHDSRHELYKMKSPSWKETYRNRCLSRLRENRSKCHFLRRQLHDHSLANIEEKDETENKNTQPLSIDEIMEDEWRLLSRGSDEKDTNTNDYIDSMVSLYDEVCRELKLEIQKDLEKEEAWLLRNQEELDAELQREEEELCMAVKALSTDEVICPLCEKSSLLENKGIIFCRCGLRIDTEQDCVSLKYIKASLQTATVEHSKQCEAKPEFTLTQKFGITNLLMSCQECDFLFIII